ncbi:MAG: DNA topoisomerase I [Thaumarchaeota archaeon]|nr:DNA topoisomerase I [Nitrososphaerota archaeon]MCL5317586.1 DNA topoisomerase I [Nitrososphaerota archaeon]
MDYHYSAAEPPYTLVICEKPDAAQRIADALKEGDLKQSSYGRVKTFTLTYRGRRYVICSALGHLYSIGDPSQKRHIYPVFDVEWFPAYKMDKKRSYTAQRIETIHRLAAGADSFINACDFDLEGETIGYNILKYACGEKQSNAFRAKFSTLTEEELREAFQTASRGLGEGLAQAGRTRHAVDFIFGINLSRALSESYYASNKRYRVVTIGRVQGPTLSYAVQREIEIRTFVTTPFWTITAELDKNGTVITAEYEKRRIAQLAEVNQITEACRGKTGTVSNITRSRFQQPPPTPFDIGDLQKEVYRIFGYSPSQTLKIAERLYLDALISYPRTSSQKLPPSINYRKILSGLQRNREYTREAEEVSRGRLQPHEGAKTDPAHPAIYPTGELPRRTLTSTEKQLYDLVVRRFLAVFSEYALREGVSATINIAGYLFKIYGRITLREGWLKYYRKYTGTEDRATPNLAEGEELPVLSVIPKEKFDQPPPRYNQSSLLEKMEAEEIGTKATRADIIKTLYDRGYLAERSIIATDLAFSVVELMAKHSPRIISTEMTRGIEEHLRQIEQGEIDEEQVIQEAVDQLYESLTTIKDAEEEIGVEMTEAITKTVREMNSLGPCPKCKTGTLHVIRSKKTHKRFVGCSNYQQGGCNASAPLPQKGTLTIPGKSCPTCGWPIVYVRFGRYPWRLCINMNCPTKEKEKEKKENETPRKMPTMRKRSSNSRSSRSS